MRQLLLSFFILWTLFTKAQSPFVSQSVIKYDVLSHSTDKPIPFDSPFTLLLEKTSLTDIVNIYAYQTEFRNGIRTGVLGKYSDKNGKIIIAPIFDTDLIFEKKKESLYIYFPALKPGVLFDLVIETGLNEDCLKELLKVNILIAKGEAQKNETADKFDDLESCAYDPVSGETAFDIDWVEYQYFFKTDLAADYMSLNTTVDSGANLSVLEIMALCQIIEKYPNCDVLYEAARLSSFAKISQGIVDINDIFKGNEADIYDADQRIINLISNQVFFEDLLKKMSVEEAKGKSEITIERVAVKKIYETVTITIKTLKDFIEKRSSIIKKNTKIRQKISLSGNTVSSDLKSASGRVLFGDMGLSTIFAEDLNGDFAKLPAIHLGFSIYFRSIDKNTRYNRFRDGFYKKKQKIYREDAITGMPGPDYEMLTKPSLAQHISLSIGLTLNSFTNKEFDNFYKSNSLLIGPAYRFYRGFKISSGVALLRRNSMNPLISEKKVIAGAYLSFSVDVDFLGGIEKVTSIVFK